MTSVAALRPNRTTFFRPSVTENASECDDCCPGEGEDDPPVPPQKPDDTGDPRPSPKPRVLLPSELGVGQQYGYYKSLVERNGGRMTEDGPTVLGVRGENIHGNVHDTTSCKLYDDFLIVLPPDPRQPVEVFAATTHPAQKTSSQSPHGAVGEIMPGTFVAVPHGLHYGIPCFQLLNPDHTDHLLGWRDYDHNGIIDSDEKNRSVENHETLSAVLIHASKADDHPTSIGCQVLSPHDQRRFVALVGQEANFNYTMLDVHEATLPEGREPVS